MAADDEMQKYIADLPFKVKRELVAAIKVEADHLADAIKAAAPVNTGALRDSVKVRRTKNELTLFVTAGGDATTRAYERNTGYESEVVIDGRDNSGKAKQADGAGVSYDYAMAIEYGTSKENAQPFFYPTVRAMEDEINQNIESAVERALK